MKIDYVRICSASPEELCRGFVKVYKEAFGGPPYYEQYSDADVIRDVWIPHLSAGIIVLALDAGSIVGFGCAQPVSESPEYIQGFLQAKKRNGSLPIDLSSAWYMSELGVQLGYRGHHIAYALTLERLVWISELGSRYYTLRTAAQGSNSLHLYRKIGSIELSNHQDVSQSDQVQINKSQSTERIYLCGQCSTAIATITEIVRL